MGAKAELPPLPKPDRQECVPAVEYSRVSLARDLIRQRKAARLSQQELADLAGVPRTERPPDLPAAPLFLPPPLPPPFLGPPPASETSDGTSTDTLGDRTQAG